MLTACATIDLNGEQQDGSLSLNISWSESFKIMFMAYDNHIESGFLYSEGFLLVQPFLLFLASSPSIDKLSPELSIKLPLFLLRLLLCI